MESRFIIVGVQIALSVIAAVAALVAVRWARLGAQEGESTRKIAEAIADAFHKAHGTREPCPAGAAEVVSPAPSSTRVPAGTLPVAARAAMLPTPPPAPPGTPRARPSLPALPPVEVAVDARSTVEIPALASAPPAAPSPDDRESADEVARAYAPLPPRVGVRVAGVFGLTLPPPAPRFSERTAAPAMARVETTHEAAARMRHHCHGPRCGDWECSCPCEGCAIGRGDRPSSRG